MAPLRKNDENPVEPPDSHILNAAQGWLELGNASEAAMELSAVSPALEMHPDVLEIKWNISAAQHLWEHACGRASELVKVAPHRCSGWIQRSFALHELKRTTEAYEMLLPAAAQFSHIHTVPYNLACYCCQLQRIVEARQWLEKAIKTAGLQTIKRMAETDPDLAPMREEIRQWKSR